MAQQNIPGNFPDWIDPDEARVINKLITCMCNDGGEIRVRCYEDPNDIFVGWTRDRKAIQAETAATCGTLFDYRRSGCTRRLVTVLLVHGNGEEVISDFSAPDEDSLDLAESLFSEVGQ